MAYNWIAILGKYEFREEEIVFVGGERDYGESRGSAIGNAVCDQMFSGGEITAKIEFQGLIEQDTGCEIIIYFEPATKYFVSAGIGGEPLAQFSARYFDSRGWNIIAASGERINIQCGMEYEVRVVLTGSVLSLWVSGVEVIRATVPFTLPAGQVGIWNRGRSKCTIRDYRVATEEPTAFVAMQFSPPYNDLFADVINPICEEFRIKAIRSDETFSPGLIIADIVTQINTAKVVLADITPENPNVFWELGYAHASRKPTILISEKGRKLPFDVSGFRILFYENTIAGKRLVEDGLRKHLKAILTELRIPTTGAAGTVVPPPRQAR